ncbi:MAG: VWA domain-containing protein, partial [Xanthobacteraceae bacterium]
MRDRQAPSGPGFAGSSSPASGGGETNGRLAENILYFARALRAAGIPVGPGAVLDALEALKTAGVGTREDFYWTLHAVFVKRHEHTILFDQAFRIFFRRRGYIDQLIAMMMPQAPASAPQAPQAGATRVHEALYSGLDDKLKKEREIELDARLTVSDREVLQKKDFAQMTSAEIAAAKEAMKRLVLPLAEVRTRRLAPHVHGHLIDIRRTLRASMKGGGDFIDLRFIGPKTKPPPIVALLDISGSMSQYSRVFLHFLHALTDARKRVSTFLFGTRLTNVTRALRERDPDDAMASCSAAVPDWSGGTRIASSLHAFNKLWARRVLTQGAIVLLITDGLERDNLDRLGAEMERLEKSSRRIIWVNPLLRFGDFAAKAG